MLTSYPSGVLLGIAVLLLNMDKNNNGHYGKLPVLPFTHAQVMIW